MKFPYRSFLLFLPAAALTLCLFSCGVRPTELNTAGLGVSPTAAPAQNQPTAAPATPAPTAAPDSAGSLDTTAADYLGNITELTADGFTMMTAQVTQFGGEAAALSSGAPLDVRLADGAQYIAVYADGAGNSRQEAGSAELLAPDAFVYVFGHKQNGVFTADTVAVLNP